MDDSAPAIVRVVVHGRVQGVGYRAWVQACAQKLGLEGWVRNRRDDTVEAVLCGAPAVVAAMVADCRRGPPASRVTQVDETVPEASVLDQRRKGERFSVLATL